MYLIDSHTHVYLPEFADDRKEVLERAMEQGVEMMFLPAIDSSTHDVMMEMERIFPQCKAMMGLHPCSVKPDFDRACIRSPILQVQHPVPTLNNSR